MEALFYEKIDVSKEKGARVKCLLCPHECVIADGKRGICNVRENRSGKLIALTYGRIASAQMDPIEKKPLYHLHPGSQILSLGSVGCNFACGFCQNWSLVTSDIPSSYTNPEDVPELAKRYGSIGVAYTYNEPFIWYEFLLDSGTANREAGLLNVLVTNGFINREPLERLLPLIDAMNIDLKSINDSFYRKNCKGRLDPVKETIRYADEASLVEVTCLIVPGENDSDEDIIELADFIAGVNVDIPLHLSRYLPHRSFKAPPTPAETMLRAYDIAKERLNYVYVGNIAADVGSDSYCPVCNALLVERTGYRTKVHDLSKDTCGICKTKLNFIG
jgi:pyruvate formate lyase activating enzyme